MVINQNSQCIRRPPKSNFLNLFLRFAVKRPNFNMINSNKVSFKKSFNISRSFEKLIDGFKFYTDPKDGIKDVKIKDITVVSPCESYDFSFAINDNKKAIFDAMKAKNISARCLVVKEIALDVVFYDGVLDKKKNNRMLVKISYFSQCKTTNEHPVINKYLESWGLLEGRHC